MILTVSGWREWTDVEFVLSRFRGYMRDYQYNLYVRVGCCGRGVDKIIRDRLFVPGTGIQFIVYYADWSLPNRSGGPVRNKQMLRGENVNDLYPNQVADRLLAFPQPGINWKKDKSGTVGCILEAVGLGVDLDVPGYIIK